jgi:succinoglycan biosynthesis transport protein ExoP
VVSVIVAVAAALAYSKLHTPVYQSTALIQTSTTSTTSGQSSTPVTLPDPVQALGSTAVQLKAAQLLKDPDVNAVASQVTGTVDPITGALTITASDTSPQKAQAIAAAYSQSYLDYVQSVVSAQSAKITTQLGSLETQIAGLENKAQSGLVTAEITSLEQTVSQLETEQQDITLGEPYATIQVAAGVPTTPTGLGKSKLILIGALAGLLVGCGIALARDQFDTRLRTTPDIASVTEAPILAELPEDNEVRSGKVAIAMLQAPQSRMAEAVRELRTSLRVILDDTPFPVLVVTSPEPGDGKTFITANLAASWAMSGSKVIVVSADFRRPRLEEIFGLEVAGQAGLSNLIRANWNNSDPDNPPNDTRTEGTPPARSGERRSPANERQTPARSRRSNSAPPDVPSVSSLLVDTGIWGLQVLPAGTQLENPSELFGSPGMQPVLDQIQLLADVVLLDTPPVLAVPDTAILGSLARGAVIVASEGHTDRTDLERTVRRLENTHCRVLGIAINRVKRSGGDSYQSYAYKQ